MIHVKIWSCIWDMSMTRLVNVRCQNMIVLHLGCAHEKAGNYHTCQDIMVIHMGHAHKKAGNFNICQDIMNKHMGHAHEKTVNYHMSRYGNHAPDHDCHDKIMTRLVTAVYIQMYIGSVIHMGQFMIRLVTVTCNDIRTSLQ